MVLTAACASPTTSTSAASGPSPVADVDAVVAVTTELVRAWSLGPGEVLKVLQERFGARAVGDASGLVVQSTTTTPTLGFVVDLDDVPVCRDPRAGVVVGDPPRVSGCGARAMAGLAAFVVAVERDPVLRLEVLAGRAPTPGPARVWAGTGGTITRVGDDDVFDLDLVDAGAVTIDLRRPGGAADLEGLVVSAGRALAWRGPVHRSAIAVARDEARGLWARLTSRAPVDDAERDVVSERCRLVAPPTPTAVRLWCHLLPGNTPDAVVEGVTRAVDDPRVVVEVAAVRLPSSTPPTDGLAVALRGRLGLEGIATRPALRVEADGSPCDVLRREGTPCVGGVPLGGHPASRVAVGSADERVDVAEVGRLAARVADVVAALSDDRPRATDGGP